MNRVQFLGSVLALLFATAALAQTPEPRSPIGQRGMLPDPRDPLSDGSQQLSTDVVRISNIGNQQLFLAYWDGESNWRQVSINAGQGINLACAKCAGAVTVAFHNGKEDKKVKLTGGGRYMLGWSAQTGTWVLTSSSQ